MSSRTLNLLLAISIAILATTADAQFPIRIPSIPKIKKEKITERSTNDSSTPQTSQVATSSDSNERGSDDIWDNVKTPALYSHRDNVRETLKEIERYTPETQTRVVSPSNYDWLLRAISPSNRKAFLDEWGVVMTPPQRKWFEDNLDAISKAAATKLPLFVAGTSAFQFRNPAEEQMMKRQLSDIPGVIIHKIGLASSAWNIGKDGFNFPINRYKYGTIWGRNPNAGHPYCSFWYVNIIQDYAGGGTYGASYAKYVGAEIAGCPASK